MTSGLSLPLHRTNAVKNIEQPGKKYLCRKKTYEVLYLSNGEHSGLKTLAREEEWTQITWIYKKLISDFWGEQIILWWNTFHLVVKNKLNRESFMFGWQRSFNRILSWRKSKDGKHFANGLKIYAGKKKKIYEEESWKKEYRNTLKETFEGEGWIMEIKIIFKGHLFFWAKLEVKLYYSVTFFAEKYINSKLRSQLRRKIFF